MVYGLFGLRNMHRALTARPDQPRKNKIYQAFEYLRSYCPNVYTVGVSKEQQRASRRKFKGDSDLHSQLIAYTLGFLIQVGLTLLIALLIK